MTKNKQLVICVMISIFAIYDVASAEIVINFKTANIYFAAGSEEHQPRGVLLIEAVIGGGCEIYGPPLIVKVDDRVDPIVIDILGFQLPLEERFLEQNVGDVTCAALTISEAKVPIHPHWFSASPYRKIDVVLSGERNHYELSQMESPPGQITLSLTPQGTKNVFSNFLARNYTAETIVLHLLENR